MNEMMVGQLFFSLNESLETGEVSCVEDACLTGVDVYDLSPVQALEKKQSKKVRLELKLMMWHDVVRMHCRNTLLKKLA